MDGGSRGDRRSEIAQLLDGEAEQLSHQEQEEVLRNRLSYAGADLFFLGIMK